MNAPYPAGQLPLCRGCGVVAPLEQARCESCSHELETPRWWVPVAEQQLLWVQVRVSFECRACGHRSPIDYLDIDGSVRCLSCGIEQRFENKQWWAALEQAHAVADLTGPHPEGLLPEGELSIAKVNPHLTVGVSQSAVEVERGEQALRLVASPGAPLCDKCHGVLAVAGRGERKLTLRCGPCNIERRYALPQGVSQRARALQGVVAPAHEEGRLDAVVQEEGGVAALRCPTCGAGLTADGASIVTCQYCQTSSRVDARARGKSQRDVEPTPFWLLFEGPSAQRKKLQNRAEAERNRERKDNERAAQQRAQARAMDRPRDAPPRKPKRSPKQTAATVAGIVAVVGFTGLAVKLDLDRDAENERLAAQRQQDFQAKQRADAARESERRSAVQRDVGEPFSVSITMDVVKAEGQPLEPGSACVVYGAGNGDTLKELHVSCGSALLYDSTAKVFGMRMMDRELYRASPDEPPTGLRYQDTGQRTGGSEITLDTKVGQGVISSQTVPLFRVELGPHQERPAKPSKPRKPAR